MMTGFYIREIFPISGCSGDAKQIEELAIVPRFAGLIRFRFCKTNFPSMGFSTGLPRRRLE